MYDFTCMEVGIHVPKPIPLLLIKHRKKLQIIHILLKLLFHYPHCLTSTITSCIEV